LRGAALARFALHPGHLDADRGHAKWYAGFRVVIAEAARSCCNVNLEHFTPDDPAARRARRC